MPVKDSPDTTREAIAALVHSEGIDFTFIVYNDFSSAENTAILQQLADTQGFRLFNWSEHTDHPSPNYRLTLQDARQQALADGTHLIIVESDVIVRPDTLRRIVETVTKGVGMVAAVTVDNDGNINFPYLYAKKISSLHSPLSTKKRFSFCCTLLSNEFLQACDFDLLDPTKDWFDVALSHQSLQLGFRNLLMLDNPVIHRPHSSRPWKLLKYTNPIRYYWQKIIRKRDRI